MNNRVKGPAIGLIVVGVMTLLLVVFGLVFNNEEAARETAARLAESFKTTPEQIERFQQFANGFGRVLFSCTGAFLIYAGLQMKQLRGRTVAIIASVVAMIPCLTSCCCLAGIPVGVWSLITLLNADVKNAFAAQASPPPLP